MERDSNLFCKWQELNLLPSEYKKMLEVEEQTKKFVESCLMLEMYRTDTERLFVRCFMYMERNFPDIRSSIKASILYNVVVLGHLFAF